VAIKILLLNRTKIDYTSSTDLIYSVAKYKYKLILLTHSFALAFCLLYTAVSLTFQVEAYLVNRSLVTSSIKQILRIL